MACPSISVALIRSLGRAKRTVAQSTVATKSCGHGDPWYRPTFAERTASVALVATCPPLNGDRALACCARATLNARGVPPTCDANHLLFGRSWTGARYRRSPSRDPAPLPCRRL